MKVQGTYASVVRGVSQQAPADRLEGQHGEVVNMISDPVRGLVRRNGFVLEAYSTWLIDSTSQAERTAAVEDGSSFRTFSYRANNIDYDVLYRTRPAPMTVGYANLTGLILYDRTYDAEQFVPTRYDITGDIDAGLMMQAGYSAITNIGQFVVAVANGYSPTVTTSEKWGVESNLKKAAVWIRGGGYSRTYTLKAKRSTDGVWITVSYTTPSAQYAGVLDFSTITEDPSTPEYQAEVNRIQAEYDTAVNQWTASSSAAIVPAAIAQALLDALVAAGWTGASYWERVESTLLCSDVLGLEVTDGGNGEFVKETLSDEVSVTDLPIIAHYNKVVRISPPGADPYYMEAYPQNAAASPSEGWGRVKWRESAGTVQTPGRMFSIGLLHKGIFYYGSTPAKLAAVILAQTGDTVEVPTFPSSTVGDLDTDPTPAFFRLPVTMLASFQDRLIVGSGGTITMSEQGQYFNFFRTTVLTVPDSDPVGVSSVESGDDTIRFATVHEMNLFVHADKRHYMVPGRQAVTPQNASMAVMWEVQNAAGARPVSNGANLFVAKEELQVGASRLLQVQPGLYQDIPQLQDVSQQLRDYINGYPAEVVAFLNPGTVFIRTEPVPKSKYGFPRSRYNGIYMYQYTDQGEERVVDAWSAWEWSEHLGRPIGMSAAGFGDTLRVFTYVQAQVGTNMVGVMIALRASIRPDPSGLPYLDGLQLGEVAQTSGIFTPAASSTVRAALFTSPGARFSYEDPFEGHNPDVVLPAGPHWTTGDTNPTVIDPIRWAGVSGNLVDFENAYGVQPAARQAAIFTGLKFHAYVELTNPFVRVADNKADTNGTLKLTRLHVVNTRTAGMEASWKDHDGQTYVTQYQGDYSQINYSQNVFVGRDTKHVQIRLAAKDWLPLTINAISWKGNYLGYKQQV